MFFTAGKWIANHRGPVNPTDGLFHNDPYVDAPSTPLFAFGAGLSYGGAGSFQYSGTSASVTSSATTTVSTSVRNVAKRSAVETVLVFATAPLDNIVRYYK